jgi:hypothetical protein
MQVEDAVASHLLPASTVQAYYCWPVVQASGSHMFRLNGSQWIAWIAWIFVRGDSNVGLLFSWKFDLTCRASPSAIPSQAST